MKVNFPIFLLISFSYSETNVRPVLKRCCTSYEYMTKDGCKSSIHEIDVYADLAEVWDKFESNNYEIVDDPLMSNCPFLSTDRIRREKANLSINSNGQLTMHSRVIEEYCLANIKGDLLLASCGGKFFGMFIGIVWLCSSVCLPTTAIVYCCIKRTMHETLLLFFILTLIVTHYGSIISGFPGEIACAIGIYLVMYFFMVSLFLSNVLYFNIWSLLRSQCKRDRAQKKRLLVYYMLYAFGGPLVMSGTTALMQFLLPIESGFHPEIGYYDGECVLEDNWSTFGHYNGVTICLTIIDIIFLASTATTVWRMDIEIKKHLHQKINAHKYVKLFFGMRVPGILATISILLEFTGSTRVQGFMNIMTMTTICSEGVWIFILFVVVSKPVKRRLKQLCCCISSRNPNCESNMTHLNIPAAGNP